MQPTRRARASRFPTEQQLELVRRAAECAGVGLLWALFSVPIVTAGAAWIAAATVFDAWTRGEEPPLLRTFTRVVRTQFGAGLLVEVAALAVVVITYFDVRFALAAAVPGARVEAFVLALLGAAATGLLLLTVAQRAHTGADLRASARSALALSGHRPWLLPLVIAAVAVAVALTSMVPAFALVLAGPLAFAVCVVATRARPWTDGPIGW